MSFKEYKADGEFVLGPDGGIKYDGLDPRSAGIIAELLTYQSILEDEKAQRDRVLELLIAAGFVTRKKVNESFKLAKSLK